MTDRNRHSDGGGPSSSETGSGTGVVVKEEASSPATDVSGGSTPGGASDPPQEDTSTAASSGSRHRGRPRARREQGKVSSGKGNAKRSSGGKTGSSFLMETKEIFVYQPLLDQLKDESPLARESACWTLGELRYKAAAKAISRLLTQDPDVFVRLGAARALEKIGDSWAVQAVIRGLKDEDPLVRQVCINALGRLQDKQAIYPLEQLIKVEEDKDIRDLAQTALLHISGKPRGKSSPWERKVFKYLRQIELEPSNANAHHNLAVSYFHAKRYRDARRYCKRARQLGANVDWLEGKLREVDAKTAQAGQADHRTNGRGG